MKLIKNIISLHCSIFGDERKEENIQSSVPPLLGCNILIMEVFFLAIVRNLNINLQKKNK